MFECIPQYDFNVHLILCFLSPSKQFQNLNGEMVLTKNDINTTWRAMESLVDEGMARQIGLSNFNCQHIRQILSIARIRPTTLQVECHPHLSQVKLLRFAREAGIRVTGEWHQMLHQRAFLITNKKVPPYSYSV